VTDFTHDLGAVPLPQVHRLAGRRDAHDLSYHLHDLCPGYRA
jgi:hypothetical protein